MSNPAEAELLVQFIYDDPIDSGVINPGCINFDCRRGEIVQSVFQGVLSYFETDASGQMHVSAIDLSFDKKVRNYFVCSQVTIQDEDGNSVPGAVVSINITQPDGTLVLLSDITGMDGSVPFKIRSDQVGLYGLTVADVSRDGWIYDDAANVEISDYLFIP